MLLLHLVAWGAVLAVGFAFVFVNWQDETLGNLATVTSAGGICTYTKYGWPSWYLECESRQDMRIGAPIENDSTFHPFLLICDVVVGMVFVAATFFVFVFPFWSHKKLFQIKLESFFILTATVAVLCAAFRLAEPYSPYHLTVNRPTNFFVYNLPLYLQIPLGLGVGCTIYWLIWIVLRLVTALVRLLVKRRVVTQSE